MDDLHYAFSEGSDARLAGKHHSANPYPSKKHGDHRYGYWKLGWHDVNSYWASEVNGRWLVLDLPEVRKGVA